MDPSQARHELVTALRLKGIRDERVLEAIRRVPRHLFLPSESGHLAYMDEALSIGFNQTISQPYVVAMMIQSLSLKEGDKVLDVGTGSGYQAAILARLLAEVITIEVVPELSSSAQMRVKELGIENVRFIVGDGSSGVADDLRFDGIIVAAAAPRAPQMLVDQLAEGGRMVIPLGSRSEQQLTLIRKVGTKLVDANLGRVRFVPLVGRYGFVDPSLN